MSPRARGTAPPLSAPFSVGPSPPAPQDVPGAGGEPRLPCRGVPPRLRSASEALPGPLFLVPPGTSTGRGGDNRCSAPGTRAGRLGERPRSRPRSRPPPAPDWSGRTGLARCPAPRAVLRRPGVRSVTPRKEGRFRRADRYMVRSMRGGLGRPCPSRSRHACCAPCSGASVSLPRPRSRSRRLPGQREPPGASRRLFLYC